MSSYVAQLALSPSSLMPLLGLATF